MIREDRKHEGEHSYQAGLASKKKSDFKGAIRQFQAALRMDPEHVLALQELGWCTYFVIVNA